MDLSVIPSEAWVVGALALISVVFGFATISHKSAPGDPLTMVKAAIWILWTVVPPVSLLARFWLSERTLDQQHIEAIKYRYELASQIWVAFASALTGIFFGKDVFRKD